MTTFQIVNKNDNTIYTCDVPFIYVKNANETLDSATIRLSHLNREIEIEPFDDAIIEDDALGTIYLCVDTFTCIQESLDDTHYQYEISLFSRTKHLECMLCPSMSITYRYGSNRKIYDYLSQYNALYGEKIRTNNGFVEKYPISQRAITKFSNVEIVEMQWNQPTLREVFNDLMMVKDCIPIINGDNEVDYLDLTEINVMSNATKSHINYVTKSQSSADYVSELQMNLQNVIQKNYYRIDIYTREEMIHFDSDDGILTTDNVYLKTAFPIYDIEEVILYIPTKVLDNVSDTTYDNYIYEVNITGLIKEYDKYQTLPVADSRLNATLGQYQNSSLYYHRGNNRIEGFDYLSPLWKSLWDGPNETTIQAILDQRGLSALNRQLNMFQPDRAYAKIKYVPLSEVMFRASKSDNPSNKRIVVDNQTNSYVNPENQGMLEYFKANRLGNLQLQITARYNLPTEDALIDIFDKYNDSIVYQVQYQVYNDHLEINALATKDYVLRNYYTGIKAKIRSWNILSGDEAFIRNEFIKIYCEFSLRKHQDFSMGEFEDFADWLANDITKLGNWTDDNLENTIKYVVATTPNTPAGGKIYLELAKTSVNNSICYTFGFDDNFYAGKGLKGWDNNLSGNIFDYYSYSDNYGENSNVIFTFLSGLDNTKGSSTYTYSEEPYSSDINQPADAIDQKMFKVLSSRPLIPSNAYEGFEVFTCFYSYLKDNKEITKMNLQFEFCSETDDVYFNKEFVNFLGLIRHSEGIIGTPTFYIFKGPQSKWNSKNPTLDGATMIGYVSIGGWGDRLIASNVDETTIRLRFNTSESSDNAFYLCTEYDGGIIFGINGSKSCYLNLLKDRDKNIYDDDGNIIGTI